MAHYSIEPSTRKYIKRYGFLSFVRNQSDKYGNKMLNTATKAGLDDAKAACKKLVHKTVAATGQLTGNKIADKIAKPKFVP